MHIPQRVTKNKQQNYLDYLSLFYLIKSTDTIIPDEEVHITSNGSNETVLIEKKPVTSEYFNPFLHIFVGSYLSLLC